MLLDVLRGPRPEVRRETLVEDGCERSVNTVNRSYQRNYEDLHGPSKDSSPEYLNDKDNRCYEKEFTEGT